MARHEPPLMSLRKETPPPAPGGSGRLPMTERYKSELATMAAEPGEWFAFLDYGERTSTATSTKVRLMKQTSGYEFVARNGVVYGRYLNGAKS